jgi:hypothetical protein
MKPTRPQNKGQPTCRYGQFPRGRQAVGLGLPQIDRQNQRHRAMRMGAQDADAARLDPAANRIGRIGDQIPIALGAQHGPVIGHQRGAKAIISRASVDLPAPEGPRISSPRPRCAIQDACTIMSFPPSCARKQPRIAAARPRLLAFVAKS